MTEATPSVIATTPSSLPPATDRARSSRRRSREPRTIRWSRSVFEAADSARSWSPPLLKKFGRHWPTCLSSKLSTSSRPLIHHYTPLSSLVPPRGSVQSFRVDPRFGDVAGQFLCGEGLLILEIQERLLNFLVAYCRSILHDIPDNDLTSARFPVQPPLLHLKTETETDRFTSLAVMAEEAIRPGPRALLVVIGVYKGARDHRPGLRSIALTTSSRSHHPTCFAAGDFQSISFAIPSMAIDAPRRFAEADR